jgi:hypothetical protein
MGTAQIRSLLALAVRPPRSSLTADALVVNAPRLLTHSHFDSTDFTFPQLLSPSLTSHSVLFHIVPFEEHPPVPWFATGIGDARPIADSLRSSAIRHDDHY